MREGPIHRFRDDSLFGRSGGGRYQELARGFGPTKMVGLCICGEIEFDLKSGYKVELSGLRRPDRLPWPTPETLCPTERRSLFSHE
jgi:hypothetical protein